MAYRDEVLADSPSAFFEFNETSGTTVTSSVGTVTASATGTIAMGQPGTAGGKSVYFNGSGSQLVISDYADFIANPSWTVESWVKMPTTLTTDYPTFYRRDGNGKTFIVRGRGPGAVSRINIIESYLTGNTVDTGTTTYNNNTWTHVVTTLSGGVQRLYINGVLATVSNGTITAGGTGTAAPFYIGNGGNAAATAESMVGNMANVAIYNTVALSQARVTAHYNAGIDKNNTVTTTPATMSAVAVMPVVFTKSDATVAVASATMDLTAPNAVVSFETAPKSYGPYSYAGYWQQILSGGSGQYFASDPARAMQQSVAKHAQSFTIPSSEVSKTSKVMLKLTMYPVTNAGSVHNVTVSQLEKAPGIWQNHFFMNPVTVQYPAAGANESNTREFDITPIVKGWDAGDPNYGLAIDMRGGPSDVSWIVSNYTVEIYLPTKVVTYSVDPMTGSLTMTNVLVTAVQGVTINVNSASVNALMLGPTVETVDSVVFSVSPMTASAHIVNVAMPNVKVEVEPMAISALINNPLVVPGVGKNVVAEVATGSALMNNALFSNKTDLVFNVEPMRAGMLAKEATNFADPRLHPYWKAINRTTDNDDLWLMFNETVGPKYVDEVEWRMDGDGTKHNGFTDQKYYGSPVFQAAGPADRPAVSFNGIDDYIKVGPVEDNLGSIPTYTVEFVFRTTRRDQMLFNGAEYGVSLGGITSLRSNSIQMRDGKLTFVQAPFNGPLGQPNPEQEVLRGYKDLADGEWHHVVLSSWWHAEEGLSSNVSMGMWIDGKLDRRMAFYNLDMRIARPDFIGRGTTSAASFQGEFSMFVARRGYALGKHDIEQNYYVALGVNPVRVPPMTVDASMPNAKSKGNSVRVLYISHSFESFSNRKTSYDQDTKRLIENWGTVSDINSREGWRDPVTDELRMFDLRKDVDIESYDMIFIENSYQERKNWVAGALRTTPQKAALQVENLYDSIRWAVAEKGLKLFIDDAQVAKEMGFIDNYDSHLVNYEQDFSPEAYNSFPNSGKLGSPFVGQYDYWSWKNDPWGPRRNPHWYLDTHYLSGERIVATEPGLTDTPGYTLAEAYNLIYADPWQLSGDEIAFRYDPNESGIKLGQEMLFTNRAYTYWKNNEKNTDPLLLPVVSIPSEFVNVGTIIAKEMSNDWVKDQRPANPYADNATTIIIKEGDIINGVPSLGRVVIAPNANWSTRPTISIGIPGENESPEKKKWQTHTLRAGGGGYIVIDESGKVVDTTRPGSNTPDNPGEVPNTGLPRGKVIWLYEPGPMDTQKVRNGEMGYRLTQWLLGNTDDETGPGDVRVTVAPMTATVTAPTPTTVGSKNVSVKALPMALTAQMNDRADAVIREARIPVLPITASLMMNELATVVRIPPMTVSVEMVTPNFDDIFNSGDTVNLTLSKTENRTIVLYIRSEKS